MFSKFSNVYIRTDIAKHVGAILQLFFANAQKHRISYQVTDRPTHVARPKAIPLTCDPDAAYRRRMTYKGRLVCLILSNTFCCFPCRSALRRTKACCRGGHVVSKPCTFKPLRSFGKFIYHVLRSETPYFAHAV
jgi:hypothetical protein